MCDFRAQGKKLKKIRKEKDTQGKACNLDTALLGDRICGQKNINHSEETELKCTSQRRRTYPSKTQENKTKVHRAFGSS